MDGKVLVEGALAVHVGVVEAAVLVERADCLHLVLAELKVKDGDVLLDALLLAALGHGCDALLHNPAQHHLCRAALVLLGNADDRGLLEEDGPVTGVEARGKQMTQVMTRPFPSPVSP